MVSAQERINIFVRLGETLREGVPDEVVERAVAENGWFSAADVRYAVAALAEDMLVRREIEALGIEDGVEARDVAIIMAGNIPAVGFADLMYVLLAGHRAHVKFSHKDTALMQWIVQSAECKFESLECRVQSYVEGGRYDAVIATGSDAANVYFRQQFAEIPSVLRSSRSSVAVLAGVECEGLSDDIFRYCGLGCRSVSLLFVPQSVDIEQVMRAIKPSEVHPKYRNNYRYVRASLVAQGASFVDGGDFVMVEQAAFPTAVSQINYMRYSDLAEVECWIGEHQGELQCVVGRDVPFGRAQHPRPADYADGVDVMKFLRAL